MKFSIGDMFLSHTATYGSDIELVIGTVGYTPHPNKRYMGDETVITLSSRGRVDRWSTQALIRAIEKFEPNAKMLMKAC